MTSKFKIILLLILLLACSQTHQKPGKPEIAADLPPQIQLPWQVDFAEKSLAGWQIIDDQPTRETTWQIDQRLLVQTSSARVKEETWQNYLGTHIVAGDVFWRDYTFGAVLRNLSRNGVGLLFRYQDAQNYYRLLLVENPAYGGPFIRLDKNVNGKFQVLAQTTQSAFATPEVTLQLAVQARQDTLQAWLNGKKLFEIKDTEWHRGKIGFSAFDNPLLCVRQALVTNQSASSWMQEFPPQNIQVKLNHDGGSYSFGIRGVVFRDENQNGRQEENEPGIPQVAVSDGREVTLTNEYGVYSLENAEKNAQFVFVSAPTNFEKQLRFYYLLDDSLGQRTFNFPLVPLKTPETLPVKMAQITDIHVQDETSRDHFREVLERITRLCPVPEIILATGDLVENGSIRAQLEAYHEVVVGFSIPVFSVFGNHDRSNGLNRIRNYQQLLGPDYYSFDYANWHFVIFNNIIPSEKQLQWLENDLKYASEQKNVIVFQHYPPDQAQMEMLAQYSTRAIFSGHWHSNKIFYQRGITSFSTPPFRFGGIDNSPAGFRTFSLQADSVISEYIYNTLEPKINLVSPVPKSVLSVSQLEILLNIFDNPLPVSRIVYQLTRPGSYNEIGELFPKNDWSWGKRIQEPLTDGEYELNLTIWTGETSQKMVVPFTVRLQPGLHLELAENCPMFKKNPTRSGCWEKALEPPLHLTWLNSTQGHIDFAAPVVAESLVIVPGKDWDNLFENSICAFHACTGDFVWCFETRAALNHSLVIDQNRVFGQDVQGRIYALDLPSGELLWQQSLTTDPTEFWLYASPALAHDRLFAGNAAGIMALHPTDGAVLWKKKLGPHWISSCSSPSLESGRLVLGAMWNPQSVSALDALTGERLWDFRIRGTHGAPLIFEETVYVGTADGELIAIELENGHEKWRSILGDGWSPTTPTIYDSLVITGSGDGKMVAVNRFSGQPVWKFECQPSIFAFSPYRTKPQALTGSPVVTGDVLYFGATDGFLYALNARTGQLRWKYNLGAPVLSTPAISGNALYIAAFDGNVYCFIAENPKSH